MAYKGEALKDKKYYILDPILETVHVEYVRLRAHEKKALNERFLKVIRPFVNQMKKEDSTFEEIYRDITFTGSFYEKLKVSEATEFDLNLILKPGLNMKLEKLARRPGFIDISVSNSSNCTSVIQNWISNNNLDPSKVKQWLQGVIDKTLRAISYEIHGCKIRRVNSGPAITLKVSGNKGIQKEISIDLVAVIEFPSTQMPNITRNTKKVLNGSHEGPWYAVPKEKDCWRISFPKQEKSIIRDLNYFKYTIRLLKKVRDGLEMTKIASYYIKTLFLWELEKSNRTIWSESRRGCLFMHMLLRFKEALETETLPFFWDNNCNLIGHLKKNYLNDSVNKLNKFVKDINKYSDTNDIYGLENYIRSRLNSPVDFQHKKPTTQQGKKIVDIKKNCNVQ